MVLDSSLPPPSPRRRVPEIDLTGAPYAAMPSHVRASPRNFNRAMRRIYTRRERTYDRANPSVLREQLDVAEECPPPELHPARESALAHLSRAYAVAGYAQAALCVVVSAVLVAFIISFARGLLSDVSRKTRVRASVSVREAALCRRNFAENRCANINVGLTPALKDMCAEWKDCIARGETATQDAVSATVWAEAAAETINAFAERISSTSIVIGLAAAVVLLFFMSSAAFGFMHRRLVDDRLVATAGSPTPKTPLDIDERYKSPYKAGGIRPRAITFDPNHSAEKTS